MAQETVQPDYAKWLSVTEGMSYEQVARVLGEPQKSVGHARRPGEKYWLRYGHLSLKSVPHPSFYDFSILFDVDDTVTSKYDPFGGVFSMDGKPSKPTIINPISKAQYSHFPRTLDLPWQPCSGLYPITYELDLSIVYRKHPDGEWLPEWSESDEASFRRPNGPHLAISFPGAQPGRFRVRGVNSLGNGEWSEYREFEFLR